MDMEKLNEVLEDHKKWLIGADVGKRADLRWADLDMSCWPLWCGSLGVKIDEKLKKQLMYHVIDACGSEMFTGEQVEFANGFHRVGEINEIKRRG